MLAVAQDQLALRLMGVEPGAHQGARLRALDRHRRLAGAFLIVIQPRGAVDRSASYIGLVFAVCVLGGMGSIPGTLVGAFVLGLAESFASTFFGPSWAPAVSFGLLLLALAFRPAGVVRTMTGDEARATAPSPIVAFAVALALAAARQL